MLSVLQRLQLLSPLIIFLVRRYEDKLTLLRPVCGLIFFARMRVGACLTFGWVEGWIIGSEFTFYYVLAVWVGV